MDKETEKVIHAITAEILLREQQIRDTETELVVLRRARVILIPEDPELARLLDEELVIEARTKANAELKQAGVFK
jgi:hypothetical protein